MNKANGVPARAKQAETITTERVCVGRAIRMERMLVALGNGVKGSGWSYIGQMQKFAELVLFTENKPRLLASQSRCGNH